MSICYTVDKLYLLFLRKLVAISVSRLLLDHITAQLHATRPLEVGRVTIHLSFFGVLARLARSLPSASQLLATHHTQPA